MKTHSGSDDSGVDRSQTSLGIPLLAEPLVPLHDVVDDWAGAEFADERADETGEVGEADGARGEEKGRGLEPDGDEGGESDLERREKKGGCRRVRTRSNELFYELYEHASYRPIVAKKKSARN
jgi:hypothetical protein